MEICTQKARLDGRHCPFQKKTFNMFPSYIEKELGTLVTQDLYEDLTDD
jgi:hypothetical protein